MTSSCSRLALFALWSLSACASEASVCGDGVVEGAEACDDGNGLDGDGCSLLCRLEARVPCAPGEIEPCIPGSSCGDGRVTGAERCDDANTLDGDGCNAACVTEPGVRCLGAPSVCLAVCGDGIRRSSEACDDANALDGDGCTSGCAVEEGWACTHPDACTSICGDRVLRGDETCDDGNDEDGDGCSACRVTARWMTLPGDYGVPGPTALPGAVWTGANVILFGGLSASGAPLRSLTSFDPATRTWRALPEGGAPSGRAGHTMAWTGREVLVWGGSGTRDGALYDPEARAWRPISVAGAPSPRLEAVSAWTGAELIVWGGLDDASALARTGHAYDLATDTWRAVAREGAPSARMSAAAVWAGDVFFVYGGVGEAGEFLGDGGLYDPILDRWTRLPAEGAPSPRSLHKVVWTGTEVIVWGGAGDAGCQGDGARFDLQLGVWTPMSSLPAASCQDGLWMGSEMVVFGTTPGGHAYAPAVDAWYALPTENEPLPRSGHALVAMGERMFVWGGYRDYGEALGDGAIYSVGARTWATLAEGRAAAPREDRTLVATDEEMIIWGGNKDQISLGTGAIFRPSDGTWTTLPGGGPVARHFHSAVWTGTELLIFGGLNDNFGSTLLFGDGFGYSRAAHAWRPLASEGRPAFRYGHAAAWTGTEMLVWGGAEVNSGGTTALGDGARYDPVRDRWTPMNSSGAPSARTHALATWTGQAFLVWGGEGDDELYRDGGEYDPVLGTWVAIPEAPLAPRRGATQVWTGREFLIWGGRSSPASAFADGAGYEPTTRTWRALPPAPLAGRSDHVAVWTGRDMIVWGGAADGATVGDGARFDPDLGAWTLLPAEGAPSPRRLPSAAWLSEGLIVYGGVDVANATANGAVLKL